MKSRIYYYFLAAILAGIYSLFSIPALQPVLEEWEAPYLLLVLPMSMWIIFKTTSKY